ncbi:MAG: hypothetical protein J6A52_00760 [Bacilli bacterium]|nr:hypothetical protein [Bacilli bacterium]
MNGKKTKKIYIVLTYTGTVLSKIIKCYTKAEFSHVSLAPDENLDEMYSFGRLNPYNPFIGGFVKEGINIGTFGRFKKTTSAIYSFDLTIEQYEKIKEIINDMKKNKKIYRFNIIGLFATVFNIKIKRNNYFYCAEFVKYLIEMAQLDLNLPDIIRPNDFKSVDNLELRYRGLLKNYRLVN